MESEKIDRLTPARRNDVCNVVGDGSLPFRSAQQISGLQTSTQTLLKIFSARRFFTVFLGFKKGASIIVTTFSSAFSLSTFMPSIEASIGISGFTTFKLSALIDLRCFCAILISFGSYKIFFLFGVFCMSVIMCSLSGSSFG